MKTGPKLLLVTLVTLVVVGSLVIALRPRPGRVLPPAAVGVTPATSVAPPPPASAAEPTAVAPSAVPATSTGSPDPMETLVAERRKATSMCRVAIMQSLKDPASAQFTDPIDKTPWTEDKNTDYVFKIFVRARSAQGMGVHEFKCVTHETAAGWSIASLLEK